MQGEGAFSVDAVRRLTRAAQYVRMSTDHQKYSAINQAEVIADYAARRGFTIVQTYADEGRSGLNVDGRKALQALIRDVRDGRADYEAILVFDVSRWGRFQDADESAYYEFICREAGLQVHYCAEPFENDGSLTSTILKTLTRVRAGDYSRQLSVNVFMGQSRITKLGFWRGGPCGYGLRRLLIDERGAVRAQLEDGQRKCLQTDRVILVHGPDLEVETIKRMFRSFVQEGKYFYEIAAELNAAQIRTTRGLRWNGETVGKILENEKYIGDLIFNRSSFKLKQKRVVNPPDMWIRRDNAFPPIVSPDLFARAQEILRERRQRRSDQEVLDRLAALGREKGYLTRAIIAAAEDVPSTETYRHRFGSLMAAYELAGYQPSPRQRRQAKTAEYRITLDRIAAEIVATIERLGGRAIVDRAAGIVVINDECRVSLGWARPTSCGSGRVRWRVRASSQTCSDLTLLARIDATDTAIAAYYLLPTSELVNCGMKNLRMSNPIFAAACRYDSLDAFCRLCAGLEERRAA